MNSKRNDQILKLIVEEFIKTSEPVGSKALISKYNLTCSSATIRNVMASLEKDGYIEKTHVSSGRVPSAKGYQYYLDHLNEEDLMNTVDIEFQREFKKVLNSRTASVEDALSQSCKMLSELTKTATVVLGPKADQEALISLQLIKLNDTQAMAIFITDSGYVEKKTFVIENKKSSSIETMQAAVKVLNDRLAGTKLSELEEKAKGLAPLIVRMYGNDGEFIMSAFLEALVNFAAKRFEVYGEKNLLALPEFANDKDAFLNAVDALYNPHRLQKDLSSNDDLGNVRVGFTNDNKGDLAIISKSLNDKDSIAIVGPKRMDYKKILSALEYVAYMLNRKFSAESQSNYLVPLGEAQEIKQPTKKTTSKTKKTTRKETK